MRVSTAHADRASTLPDPRSFQRVLTSRPFGSGSVG